MSTRTQLDSDWRNQPYEYLGQHCQGKGREQNQQR